jgi:predicted RNA-binding protein (virulence factor B family)
LNHCLYVTRDDKPELAIFLNEIKVEIRMGQSVTNLTLLALRTSDGELHLYILKIDTYQQSPMTMPLQ